MEQFEEIPLSALSKAIEHDGIIVIDEIGFMELKSRRFRELVEKALDSPKPVIATIMKNSFDLKAREDMRLITVQVDNREKLADEVGEMIYLVTVSFQALHITSADSTASLRK